MAISPEEWRKLRAQSKSKRCDLADVSFEQRKAWMERTAGKGSAGKVGDLVLMRVDAKYVSKHSGRWDGLWIGPFRVVLTANGGLEISVQHIGTGAVLTRHTRDLRCYFSDGDDDDLPVKGEFVVHEVRGVRGPDHNCEYLIAWEASEFDLWERLDHLF